MKININGKSVEVADEDLKKAIEEKKEAIDLNVDSFIVRTADEETAYKENIRKEGITIGAEVGRKNLIKALGIEGEGLHKSDETSLNAINSFVTNKVETALKDAKIDPDKKIQEKEKDIETLRGTISELQNKVKESENMFQTYKKTSQIENTFSSLIPENVNIPKDDMLLILKNKIKADLSDTGTLIALGDDGQPIKDKTTLNPIPLKDVVNSFFSNNPQYLKGASGGAGGGDSKGDDGKQNLESFTKEMNEKGIKTNSMEFTNEMQSRLKAGTLSI